MKTDTITVGVVSYYSTSYVVDLIRNLRETAVVSELKFVVCDNTGGRDESLYETLGDTCEIVPFDPPVPMSQLMKSQKIAEESRIASPSYEHGLGLNKLFSMITSEYCLFLDPDCRILAKGWDFVCKESLRDSCVAVGAPYHSVKMGKYYYFPSPVFIFMKTRPLQCMDADWRPFVDPTPLWRYWWDRPFLAGASLARRLGCLVQGRSFYSSRGYEWLRRLCADRHKETGWRNQRRAFDNGYSARLFTPIVSSRQLDSAVADEGAVIALMQQFELFTCAGKPFLTHYHGTAHRRRKDFAETNQQWKRLSQSVANSFCQVDFRDFPRSTWNSNGLYL